MEINHDIAALSLLERAKNDNLKFNPDKIQFKTRVQVFGQFLTPDGISTGPKKVDIIR